MASDWRRPRAAPDARTPDHSATFPTLPSVAELLSSSRPRHHPTAPFVASTPPATCFSHALSASSVSTASSSAASTASWSPANPASPPVSPTDYRPARILHEPHSRRQHLPKPTVPRDSVPGFPSHQTAQDLPPQRPINGARQDSAISYHPIPRCNDVQLPTTHFPYSHQSPNDSHHPPSPRPDSIQPASPYYPPQPHSTSTPSGLHAPADSSRSHGYCAERPAPVDLRKASDPSVKTPGSASLPDNTSNTTTTTTTTTNNNNNNNGTRNHRYNVRFAVNYTSDNMPSSQKTRSDPPNTVSALSPPRELQTAPAEQPAITTEEHPVPPATSPTVQEESQPPARPRDRESSVERCQGCNEPWRRPLPNMDSVRHSSPAESGIELMKMTQNLVERLRDERRKADAAHEDWRWRHSHCVIQAPEDHAVRPTSPATSEPLDASNNVRVDAVAPTERLAGRTPNKRKPEVSLGDEQQMASKVRKVAVEPAPAVRSPAPV